MKFIGTDVLHVAKQSCVERDVGILLGEIIMLSVLTSLSFSLFSVIHSFIIIIGVKPPRVSEARKTPRCWADDLQMVDNVQDHLP